MIPRIIHYVWLGGKAIPANLQCYIDGWHRLMPESDGWQYMFWTEQSIDDYCTQASCLSPFAISPYCQQAYDAGKFAFASDYIRLWVLDRYGGVYFDTDVEVLRPFNELPEFTHLCQTPLCNSFIGFEESKAKTLGTNVIGCEPHCPWVKEILEYYERASFLKGERVEDGAERLQVRGEEYDMTPNSELIARLLEKYGLVRNGKEQFLPLTCSEASSNLSPKIHIYDYHHFSPITSTRVMRKTKDTFSIHHCYGSWTSGLKGNRIRNSVVVREIVNALIQVKRFILKH